MSGTGVADMALTSFRSPSDLFTAVTAKYQVVLFVSPATLADVDVVVIDGVIPSTLIKSLWLT